MNLQIVLKCHRSRVLFERVSFTAWGLTLLSIMHTCDTLVIVSCFYCSQNNYVLCSSLTPVSNTIAFNFGRSSPCFHINRCNDLRKIQIKSTCGLFESFWGKITRKLISGICHQLSFEQTAVSKTETPKLLADFIYSAFLSKKRHNRMEKLKTTTYGFYQSFNSQRVEAEGNQIQAIHVVKPQVLNCVLGRCDLGFITS